jgi:hypothetical protein
MRAGSCFFGFVLANHGVLVYRLPTEVTAALNWIELDRVSGRLK